MWVVGCTDLESMARAESRGNISLEVMSVVIMSEHDTRKLQMAGKGTSN